MMRRNRMWIAVMVIGIMLATTVCYLTMKSNVGKQYADGKLVQVTEPDFQELTMLQIKWG
ncbi:MAG: hypothetical protein J1E62_02320 [Lachnospiraceae bacterium]|nr:hypothetical protein [Lachnospiraceae bacterium]